MCQYMIAQALLGKKIGFTDTSEGNCEHNVAGVTGVAPGSSTGA